MLLDEELLLLLLLARMLLAALLLLLLPAMLLPAAPRRGARVSCCSASAARSAPSGSSPGSRLLGGALLGGVRSSCKACVQMDSNAWSGEQEFNRLAADQPMQIRQLNTMRLCVLLHACCAAGPCTVCSARRQQACVYQRCRSLLAAASLEKV
jgi:hypothetical protein